jgi:NAD-dependent deacetylase
VLTQNVDGLHQLAGTPAPLEIHGNVQGLSCMSGTSSPPGGPCSWGGTATQEETTALLSARGAASPVPRCPECDSVVRPDMVLFGEQLRRPALARYAAEVEP